MREGFHRGWKVELTQRGDFLRQGTNGGGGASAFAMQIDTETAQPGDTIRRVRDLRLTILLQRMRGERREHGCFDFRTVERSRIDFLHVTLCPNAGGRARNQKQIASRASYQRPEP